MSLSVHDSAAYILSKIKTPITCMKLQKLLYYGQAWSLVWDEKPLFKSRIEAWSNGPVIREIFRFHRKTMWVSEWSQGNKDSLSKDQKDTLDAIIETYGELAPHQLSELSHTEAPWLNARKGLSPLEPSENEITQEAMSEYFRSIYPAHLA